MDSVAHDLDLADNSRVIFQARHLETLLAPAFSARPEDLASDSPRF